MSLQTDLVSQRVAWCPALQFLTAAEDSALLLVLEKPCLNADFPAREFG